jgi:hypothetical protein
MARQNGDFAFSNNFEVAKAAPLDARVTTPAYAQLTSLPFAYKGMLVSVTSDGTASNNGLYRLTTADATNAANWEKIETVTNTNQLTNGAGFITASSVPTNTNQLTNGSGFITASSLPTNTNQLTNGAGFITSSSVLTNTNQLTNGAGFITSSSLPNTMRAAYLGRWQLFTGLITTGNSTTVVASQNILPQNDVRVSLRWSREDGAASSQAPTYMDDFQMQLARTKCVIKVEGLYTICYRLFTITGSRLNKSKAQSLILVEKPSMNGGTSQYTNGGVPKDHVIRHYGPMISYDNAHSVVAYGDTKTIHLGVGDQVYIQVEGLHNQDNTASRGAYANNNADESFVVFEFLYPGHV